MAAAADANGEEASQMLETSDSTPMPTTGDMAAVFAQALLRSPEFTSAANTRMAWSPEQ